MVECHTDIVEVGGSNPSIPTNFNTWVRGVGGPHGSLKNYRSSNGSIPAEPTK